MNEGDAGISATGPRLLVDELDAFGPQMIESCVDIQNGVGDVVESFPPPIEELADRRVRRQRLKQLHVGSADWNHGFFNTLHLDNFPMVRSDAVLALILGKGVVEITNRNPDMVDVEEKHQDPPPTGQGPPAALR